jgi:hypothetical protein
MRHAGQFSQFALFAKQKLTLMARQMLIQRCASQNGGGGSAAAWARAGFAAAPA